MRLNAIAKALNFTITGDADQEVRHLRFASDAEVDDLAVARTYKEASETRAKAVLTRHANISGKNILNYSSAIGKFDYASALAMTAHLFVQAGEAPDYVRPPSYNKELPAFPGVMAGENVAIGDGSVIGPYTTLGDNVIIGKNARIASGVSIESGVTVGNGAVIDTGSRIGAPAFFHYEYDGVRHVFGGIGGIYIGSNVTVGANSVIQRGILSQTYIGANTKIGSLVVIGHDSKIGENCLIVSQAGISGEVVMGDGVEVFGQAGITGRIHLAQHSRVMAQSRVSKNVGEGEIISGEHNRSHRAELRFQAKLERLIKNNFISF